MLNRAQKMFNAWYQPEYKMRREEWIYCAQLITVCWLAWGLGFTIGLLFW